MVLSFLIHSCSCSIACPAIFYSFCDTASKFTRIIMYVSGVNFCIISPKKYSSPISDYRFRVPSFDILYNINFIQYKMRRVIRLNIRMAFQNIRNYIVA